MTFGIGDRVCRVEDREATGAEIVEKDESGEAEMYLLKYDEGGEGWWPESALEAE